MLMGKGRVIEYAFDEGLEGRHLNVIRCGRVESLISAMPKVRPDAAKERLSVRDAFGHGHVGVRLRRVPVHLGSVEHRVATREQQAGAARGMLLTAILGLGGIICKLPKHYQSGLLPLAHLCAAFLPLLIGGPLPTLIAFRLGSSPQANGI